MDKLSGRLVVYLVGLASIFVIRFGIRGSAYIINSILLAAVITITVLPVPSYLTKRGIPGWLALVLSILMVVLLLGLVIATVFFSISDGGELRRRDLWINDLKKYRKEIHHE